MLSVRIGLGTPDECLAFFAVLVWERESMKLDILIQGSFRFFVFVGYLQERKKSYFSIFVFRVFEFLL